MSLGDQVVSQRHVFFEQTPLTDRGIFTLSQNPVVCQRRANGDQKQMPSGVWPVSEKFGVFSARYLAIHTPDTKLLEL